MGEYFPLNEGELAFVAFALTEALYRIPIPPPDEDLKYIEALQRARLMVTTFKQRAITDG